MAKSRSYRPRLYRDAMGNERWTSFRAAMGESDLWLAIDREHYRDELPAFVMDRIAFYRGILEEHIAMYPDFLSSLTPLALIEDSHALIQDMSRAALLAGTGPMSAVAGALAEFICHDIIAACDAEEVVVENGGDIFMKLAEPVSIAVYAGDSPLSEKIALCPGPADSPLSVCCSSATVGHALSFGTADACMTACRSGALADALATALCNKVKTAESVQQVTEEALKIPELLALVIIREDKVGLGGRLPLSLPGSQTSRC